MKPFFSYFGGKYRAAPKYPKPEYPTIIEPFAGSAGYSTRYYYHRVELYDIDPIIYGIWDYLIKVKPYEIRNLPTKITHIDDLKVHQEAKWLLGFWIAKGTTQPRKSPSAWMRNVDETRTQTFWGMGLRID